MVHHFDCSAAAKRSREISIAIVFNSTCHYIPKDCQNMYQERAKILIQSKKENKVWREGNGGGRKL